MKIVKQIDETHFEVEMEEYDKCREIQVSVAHDYVAISMPQSFCTGIDIKGKYNGGATNCLDNYRTIQIPIRAAQEIVNILGKNKYMTPEHLIHSDGRPNYMWNNYPIRFKDENDNWKVAVRGDKETEYSVLSLDLYNSLTKKDK